MYSIVAICSTRSARSGGTTPKGNTTSPTARACSSAKASRSKPCPSCSPAKRSASTQWTNSRSSNESYSKCATSESNEPAFFKHKGHQGDTKGTKDSNHELDELHESVAPTDPRVRKHNYSCNSFHSWFPALFF